MRGERMEAALSESRQDAYRIAAENPQKLDVLEALARRHRDNHVLIIGQYLDQLANFALDLPDADVAIQTPALVVRPSSDPVYV